MTINVEYYDYNTLIETKSINCMILSNAVKQFKNNNNSVVDVNQRKKKMLRVSFEFLALTCPNRISKMSCHASKCPVSLLDIPEVDYDGH